MLSAELSIALSTCLIGIYISAVKILIWIGCLSTSISHVQNTDNDLFMRDIWYGDNRDLVKWAILCHLAEDFNASRILQILFYRSDCYKQVIIDGEKRDIPKAVIQHFRNVQKIRLLESKIPIEVFAKEFKDGGRQDYLQEVTRWLRNFPKEKLIVFLDPDTGLQPRKVGLEHVSEEEANKIWDALKPGDVFVFYQHQTNRSGKDWIGPKGKQLANAMNLGEDKLKLARGPEIARDVIFFYAQKDGTGPKKSTAEN